MNQRFIEEVKIMKKKIRVVKLKSLNVYWRHDVTDLDSIIKNPLITIESFEELLSYCNNHRNENWEFTDDFPEEEKEKLKEIQKRGEAKDG